MSTNDKLTRGESLMTDGNNDFKYRAQTAPQDIGVRRSGGQAAPNNAPGTSLTQNPSSSSTSPAAPKKAEKSARIDSKGGGEKITTLSKFQAGPLCGSKKLCPTTMRREVLVPISMSKLMIFVVDMTSCRLVDGEARRVQEMKEDIQDALGIFCEGNRMQVIFSGYDGPKRQEINDDAELNIFFSKFGILAQAEGGDTGPKRKKHENPEVEKMHQTKISENVANLGMTTSALNKLRLGNCVTKIQMRKYIRQLGEANEKITLLEVDLYDTKLRMEALTRDHNVLTAEHDALKEEHEDLVASVPGQIEMAVAKALFEALEKWKAEAEIEAKKKEKEHQVAMLRERDKLQREMKQAVDKVQVEMRRAVAKVVGEKEGVQAELEAMTKKYEARSEELLASKKETKAMEDNLRSAQLAMEMMQEEMHGKISSVDEERRRKMQELEQQYESCRSQLEECIRLLEEHGIPIPGRLLTQESTLFRWHMMRVEEKFGNYIKDHAMQSPEFTLWGLKGLQLEFFPTGLQGSYEGWSALKLRIPQLHAVEGKTYRVSLRWKVMLGDEMVIGPRRDEFCDNYWWCKKGMVAWKNFAQQKDLVKYIDDKDCLDFNIEIIDATVEMIKVERAVPKSRSGATKQQLADQLQLQGVDADLLISYRGKLLEDRVLNDIVMDYINGSYYQSRPVTSIQTASKTFGSILWDAGKMTSPTATTTSGGGAGAFTRPPSRLPPQARNAFSRTANSTNGFVGRTRNRKTASTPAFPNIKSSDDNRPSTTKNHWCSSDLDQRQSGLYG